MDLLQVAAKQRGRPDGAAVAVVARVFVDDRIDQRVDDSQGRRGPAAAGRVKQAVGQVPVDAVTERLDPVMDGLTAHLEEVGDLGGMPTFVEPQQGLGAPQLRGVMGLIQEAQQRAAFPRTESEWSHRPPLERGDARPIPVSKNFCPPT
jgi:hypothetical protein